MMKKKNNLTVVVGMSGGVDSSVVALLLKKQGYNVIGLHMKTENAETAEIDAASVHELCEKIGIQFEIVDYKDEMNRVKDYFIKEYVEGKTPNPCVVCNREVKFKPFIEYADKIGADYFATGHYARITHTEDGLHILQTAADENKDQTYFLCALSNKQLSKALFPLGDLTKEEVRKIAEENELASAHKKDSFDVCFIGSSKFKDYMNKNHPEKPGNIVDALSGKIVGKHSGISKYTLGQRKGLGIGGGHGISGDCWFVTSKNIKTNTLYVAQGNDDILYSDALVSNKFNWMPSIPEEETLECFAKFRYRQIAQKVKVTKQGEGIYVEFAEKQRAITPGQYVVLYRDNDTKTKDCLGGGTIDSVYKNGQKLEL